MKFEIVIDPASHERLDALAELHAERAGDWWREAGEAAYRLGPAERRAALAELQEERRRRRKAGTYFDTRSALVAFYVQRELDQRGWSGRRWRRVPAGEASMPGRRWGVPNDGLLTAELSVSLPNADGELLRRATWHVSAPATRRLQQLAEVVTLSRSQLRERERLRAQVITPPDVIRAAIQAAIDAGPPTT